MFVILYQDAYKPRRAEVLGVYENKEKAVNLLLAFLTDNHDRNECDCELCQDYDNMKNELIETGTVLEEYSIHEVDLDSYF